MLAQNTMKPFIILASGPLCGGKSTLGEIFAKKDLRVFRVSFDMIKRQISDFDSEGDRALVARLIFVLSQNVVDEGLSLYVEGSASIFIEMRNFFQKLAKEAGLRFLEINLEAPLDVLLGRLEERVKSGKAMVVKDKEQFMRRYDLYQEHKDDKVSTYDTEKYSAENIHDMVIQLL